MNNWYLIQEALNSCGGNLFDFSSDNLRALSAIAKQVLPQDFILTIKPTELTKCMLIFLNTPGFNI